MRWLDFSIQECATMCKLYIIHIKQTDLRCIKSMTAHSVQMYYLGIEFNAWLASMSLADKCTCTEI